MSGGIRTERHVTKAKLDDGRIVIYDVCADRINAYDPENFQFIGWGVIHSVDGAEQSFTKRMCFFEKLF